MLKRDRFEQLVVTRIVEDGDGDLTVFVGTSWLTWNPYDTERRPQVGDHVLVRLPLITDCQEAPAP